MDYSIFISYRRQGGAHYARILKAELEKRGYNVFLDYDELNDGRFDSRIMRAIESAPIFIFILSPGSLDRCVDENDWVRREIVYAMQTERNIVPVNFDGLFQEFPAALPEEVRSIIGQHQFSKIDSESLLQESIDKLVRNRISPVVSPSANKTQSDKCAEIFVLTDAECSVTRFHKLLATASPGQEIALRLTKGNHLLEFISTENPEIREQIRYNVPDNEYSDFIEIRLKERLKPKHQQKFESKTVKETYTPWAYRISDACVACDTCLPECPVEAITSGDIYHIDPNLCIGCATCASVCPADAIIPGESNY